MFTPDGRIDVQWIEKNQVPLWKYWLLPMFKPWRYRQVKFTFDTGKKQYIVRCLERS